MYKASFVPTHHTLPFSLPRMLEKLERGADLVVGTRYMPGGGTTNWNAMRQFVSWTATRVTKILLDVRLRDPMSGSFMLRRKDFLRVRNDPTISLGVLRFCWKSPCT